MSLRERELDWQRERRFPVWDRFGGPGRYVRWTYRYPGPTVLFVLVVFGGLWVAPDLAAGDGARIRVPGFPIVALGVIYWHLRTAGQLHREWRERRGEASTSPPTGSWLERADQANQVRAEAENRAGTLDAAWSPLMRRFYAIWFAYVGLVVVVGSIVVLVISAVG
jgi:hypothetical protein